MRLRVIGAVFSITANSRISGRFNAAYTLL
jgi:hypothetical protein